MKNYSQLDELSDILKLFILHFSFAFFGPEKPKSRSLLPVLEPSGAIG